MELKTFVFKTKIPKTFFTSKKEGGGEGESEGEGEGEGEGGGGEGGYKKNNNLSRGLFSH